MYDSKGDLGQMHADLFPWAFNPGSLDDYCLDTCNIADINSQAKNARRFLKILGFDQSIDVSKVTHTFPKEAWYDKLFCITVLYHQFIDV